MAARCTRSLERTDGGGEAVVAPTHVLIEATVVHVEPSYASTDERVNPIINVEPSYASTDERVNPIIMSS